MYLCLHAKRSQTCTAKHASQTLLLCCVLQGAAGGSGGGSDGGSSAAASSVAAGSGAAGAAGDSLTRSDPTAPSDHCDHAQRTLPSGKHVASKVVCDGAHVSYLHNLVQGAKAAACGVCHAAFSHHASSLSVSACTPELVPSLIQSDQRFRSHVTPWCRRCRQR